MLAQREGREGGVWCGGHVCVEWGRSSYSINTLALSACMQPDTRTLNYAAVRDMLKKSMHCERRKNNRLTKQILVTMKI